MTDLRGCAMSVMAAGRAGPGWLNCAVCGGAWFSRSRSPYKLDAETATRIRMFIIDDGLVCSDEVACRHYERIRGDWGEVRYSSAGTRVEALQTAILRRSGSPCRRQELAPVPNPISVRPVEVACGPQLVARSERS